MYEYCHISAAIPMLAELANIPPLMDRLQRQTFKNFSVYCCVNNEEKGIGYDENQASIVLLQSYKNVSVIDRSSTGNGWSGKRKGVGWARKELFARIMEEHDDNEIVISLDADTDFDEDYFEAVLETMNSHPDHSAFSVPYFHPLSGDEAADRAMLRYECYMRHYLIQLMQMHNPYAFTALGSAIAFPLWAYRRVGGITPLQGGEDFYLLQKFAKTGRLLNNFCSPYAERMMTVRPQGRKSDRVPFGTGPAIAKGAAGMEQSYPFFSPAGFQAIEETYRLFPALYEHDVETPMSAFLRQQLATDNLWEPLRKNFKSRDLFVHACTERVDGLRIVQFLKSNPAFRLPPDALPVNFLHDTIATLNSCRMRLFQTEMLLRNNL